MEPSDRITALCEGCNGLEDDIGPAYGVREQHLVAAPKGNPHFPAVVVLGLQSSPKRGVETVHTRRYPLPATSDTDHEERHAGHQLLWNLRGLRLRRPQRSRTAAGRGCTSPGARVLAAIKEDVRTFKPKEKIR